MEITQRGSITVQAFQWKGGVMSSYTLANWAKQLALHTPGDGTLHVPSRNGTLSAKNTDWIVQGADGGVDVMPNAHFVALYV